MIIPGARTIPVYTGTDGWNQSTDSASERSTRRLLRSIPHVPSMKRHEINENYYRVKKVRGKIKTLARPLGKRHCRYDRKVAERKLREWIVWNGKTRRFQP